MLSPVFARSSMNLVVSLQVGFFPNSTELPAGRPTAPRQATREHAIDYRSVPLLAPAIVLFDVRDGVAVARNDADGGKQTGAKPLGSQLVFPCNGVALDDLVSQA